MCERSASLRVTGADNSDGCEGSCDLHGSSGSGPRSTTPVERSAILSTDGVLSGSRPEVASTLKLSAPVTLKEVERSHILHTLQQTKGVVSGRDGAAVRLGLHGRR
jgi:hypothetical protein